MDYDERLIKEFNQYYPFDRYIIKELKPINYLFDDVYLSELFIPNEEKISNINFDDIYVKLFCNGREFRMAYFDFAEGVRETIRDIFYEDFGLFEWESQYIDYENKEDYSSLKERLLEQQMVIKEKYGKCDIKPHFKITTTIDLLTE